MSHESESLRAGRPPETKVSFFARSTEDAMTIRIDAMERLRYAFCLKAELIGLCGTGFKNCLEDWINEAFIMAEEQLDRWDPGLGSATSWVYLKGKDVANRWFERYYTEQRKLQELVYSGSSLVHDGQAIDYDCLGRHVDGALVDDLLKNDLPLSDARILRRYLEGAPLEEIADDEGLSAATTQRRLNRAQAKARVARDLQDRDPNSPGRRALKPPSRSPVRRDRGQAAPPKFQHHRRRLMP